VHPTPLYSILWNAVIAVITARLWLLQVPASLIIGVYLILSGLGRFVEESYRGEPQTASFGGLRLYQWLAILSVLLGIGISMFNGAPVAPQPQFYWGSLTGPLVFAVVACCALGMDFPDSSRRFSRLA
jgi:prolipoprotein diacylglyceryltransferase